MRILVALILFGLLLFGSAAVSALHAPSDLALSARSFYKAMYGIDCVEDTVKIPKESG